VQAGLAPRSLLSRRAQFWVDTIALTSAIACALALAIAILGLLAEVAAEGSESIQSRTSSMTQTRESTIAKAITEIRRSSQTF
jgi:hypothetical protein